MTGLLETLGALAGAHAIAKGFALLASWGAALAAVVFALADSVDAALVAAAGAVASAAIVAASALLERRDRRRETSELEELRARNRQLERRLVMRGEKPPPRDGWW